MENNFDLNIGDVIRINKDIKNVIKVTNNGKYKYVYVDGLKLDSETAGYPHSIQIIKRN